MPRDGAIIFGDLIGKLDVLRVTCKKCGRDGVRIEPLAPLLFFSSSSHELGATADETLGYC
jgi:hypothetical protein